MRGFEDRVVVVHGCLGSRDCWSSFALLFTGFGCERAVLSTRLLCVLRMRGGSSSGVKLGGR